MKKNQDESKQSPSLSYCAYCGERGPWKCCAGCGFVHYCSRAHQKLHWKKHKSLCRYLRKQSGNQLSLSISSLNLKSSKPRIVIVGGGVTGCCIAFFLAHKGYPSQIIERAELACAASGKAGGFLAQTWCDKDARGPLMRLSWDLHGTLARKLDGANEYIYRTVDTIKMIMPEPGSKGPEDARHMLKTISDFDPPKGCADWIDGPVYRSSFLGTTENTAQVHGRLFTQRMFRAAKEKGCTLRKGVVNGITFHESTNKKVKGVIVDDGDEIPADIVIIAMGPWASSAVPWFNTKNMPYTYGQKCHSITMSPPCKPETITNTSLFVNWHGAKNEPKSNIHVCYEFYPRTHMDEPEVYIHGMDEMWRAPDEEDPLDVKPTSGACERIYTVAKHVWSQWEKAKVLANQACYMPLNLDGVNTIDRVPGVEGAFLALGSAEWGITLGPAVGLTMTQLILGEKPAIDLSKFRADRFGTGFTIEKWKQRRHQKYLQEQARLKKVQQ